MTMALPQQTQQTTTANLRAMKTLIANPELNRRMESMLGRNAGTFLASVLDLFTSDKTLSECNPNEVMQEAMKAAALHLPVVKALGFAYIVSFKDKQGIPHPTFVLGYKGLTQLAMRTGHYKTINAGAIYEGEKVYDNRITGEVKIEGEPTSEKAIGYFAHFSMINGFEKTVYWTRERVVKHAAAKSKSWKIQSSPWHTDFDAMAEKTLLRNLLSKYGEMSVEITNAIADDVQSDAVAPQETADVIAIPDETGTVIDVTDSAQTDTPAEPAAAPAESNPEQSAAAPAAAQPKDAPVPAEDVEVPF